MTVLISAGAVAAKPLPAGYVMRPVDRADADALGRLYFAAYPPGVAGDTVEEAVADIHASFDGAYGELWPDASPLVAYHGEVVGVALTVRGAPWPDVPPGPFLIELFVAAAHRRRGLAGALVGQVCTVAGEPVGLRVEEANPAARQLYASLGFVAW